MAPACRDRAWHPRKPGLLGLSQSDAAGAGIAGLQGAAFIGIFGAFPKAAAAQVGRIVGEAWLRPESIHVRRELDSIVSINGRIFSHGSTVPRSLA